MQVSAISQLIQAASAGRAASGDAGGASFQNALAEAQQGGAAHTVQPGETLSAICRDRLKSLGLDPSRRDIYAAVERVAAANGMQNPDRIHPGMQLDLSVLGGAAPEPAPAPVAAPKSVAPAYSIPGTPDPFAAVARAVPMEPLAPAPSPATLAALQSRLSLLGLNEAVEAAEPARTLPMGLTPPVAPEVEALQAGVGPLAAANEGSSLLPPSAALEKVLHLMESLVGKEPKAELSIESPWSRIVGDAAHLTSEFGIRRDPLTRRWVHHDGIDLATRSGAEIRAFKAGEVVFSGWQPGYGKVVIVRQDDGHEAVYGHNAKNLVRVGERVSESTPLAQVGSTGRSTGPHLHFEVRREGRAIDPVPFLASVDVAKAF